MPKILRVGHSPDPDDAYMFYGLAKGLVKVDDYIFEHVIEDIQSLNVRALKAELEVTAVSAAMFPFIDDDYWILNCGASVGRNYGPIVVAKETISADALHTRKIAVPGLQTTAYLLARIFVGEFEPVVMGFDQVMQAVLDGKVEAGLVIHEGQLNYSNFGLKKCLDLGELWFDQYRLPIPLGLDLVRKDLGKETAQRINQALVSSIRCAMMNEKDSLDYALQFGRGMERPAAKKFVGMYVNDDTLDLGREGRMALKALYLEGYNRGVFDRLAEIEVIGA